MKKPRFTRPISITLEAKMFEQVKQYSDLEEISLAEWIRNVLRVYIDKKEEVAE